MTIKATNVNFYGLTKLQFSHKLSKKSANFTFNEINEDIIKIQVITAGKEEDLDLSWEVVEANSDTLSIKIVFLEPLKVSASL